MRKLCNTHGWGEPIGYRLPCEPPLNTPEPQQRVAEKAAGTGGAGQPLTWAGHGRCRPLPQGRSVCSLRLPPRAQEEPHGGFSRALWAPSCTHTWSLGRLR